MPAYDQWSTLLDGVSHHRDRDSTGLLLQQALALSRDVGPGITGCSITEIDGAHYRTPLASNPLATALDQVQYDADAGPCVSAVRDRQRQHVRTEQGDARFTAFSQVALEHSVLSALSLPLTGTFRPAGLNLYSSVADAFDDQRPVQVAGLLSRCIAALLLPHAAAIPAEAPQPSPQSWLQAQERANLISQARDHLAQARQIGPQAAYTELIDRSRAEHVSITVVAEALLNASEQEPPP